MIALNLDPSVAGRDARRLRGVPSMLDRSEVRVFYST